MRHQQTNFIRACCYLFLLLAIVACSQPQNNVIRFGLASAPANLDPRYATDATSARINRLLYRRLVDFDAQYRPVPALATWEQLAPLHYRFHLKAGRAEFHDGTALNAGDVAATYQSILAPDSGSPHAGTLQLIQRITVLDSDTMDFHLHRPDPLFPGYLAIGILPAAGIHNGHPFHEKPIGSGPFRLTGWPEPGRLELTRLADKQPFEMLKIGDPTVRVLKLLRGEIDILQRHMVPAVIFPISALTSLIRLPVILGSGKRLHMPSTGTLSCTTSSEMPPDLQRHYCPPNTGPVTRHWSRRRTIRHVPVVYWPKQDTVMIIRWY
jgi:peptide/nickel transport system substrate-binding protein